MQPEIAVGAAGGGEAVDRRDQRVGVRGRRHLETGDAGEGDEPDPVLGVAGDELLEDVLGGLDAVGRLEVLGRALPHGREIDRAQGRGRAADQGRG